MVHIILTSYNRAPLLRRGLDGLMNQTCPDWMCTVADDNSDKFDIKELRKEYPDKRFIWEENNTTALDRKTKTRYSVLINRFLDGNPPGGIVGYMCDNVEYKPTLVENVLEWFDKNPLFFSGFVLHERDMYDFDLKTQKGKASDAGHWDILPPGDLDLVTLLNQTCIMDHSQVFHRLPVAVRWSEDIEHVKYGDQVFFQSLMLMHGAIHCINKTEPLTIEHLLEWKKIYLPEEK